MKIGYLTYSLDIKHGYGRFSHDLIASMQELGVNTTVVTEIDSDHNPFVGRGWAIFKNFFTIRKILADCDIIHALDGYPYGVLAYFLSLSLGKPFIISALGTYSIQPLHRPLTKGFLSYIYRQSQKIVCISGFTATEIKRVIPGLQTVEIINPGIDLSKFKFNRSVGPTKFILSVGALKERKGYEFSLEAFAMIVSEFPDLQYVIVAGESSTYADHLKHIANKYGILERVLFKFGIQDDELGHLYRTAELFILTPINDGYHLEGFGIVYLEAAAAGLPVIGTLNNGGEDAIQSEINGILVPQKDAVATAEALRKILNDPEKKGAMSEASYEWASVHDSARKAHEYEVLYLDAIARKQ